MAHIELKMLHLSSASLITYKASERNKIWRPVLNLEAWNSDAQLLSPSNMTHHPHIFTSHFTCHISQVTFHMSHPRYV
jgi:hypothetical protein